MVIRCTDAKRSQEALEKNVTKLMSAESRWWIDRVKRERERNCTVLPEKKRAIDGIESSCRRRHSSGGEYAGGVLQESWGGMS
jgi:hypothetical protein